MNLILDKKRLRKRISMNLNIGLLNLERSNKDFSITYKQYFRAAFCGSDIDKIKFEDIIAFKHSHKISKKGLYRYYCNSKSCLLCNSIRSAKYFEKYGKPIKKWKDLYLVTLTLRNVDQFVLRYVIESSLKLIRQWYKNHKKIFKQLKYIRKIETTYNLELDNYHPHFHFLISGKDNAESLVDYWLKYNKTAEPYCQDIRPVKEKDNAIKEVFKYITKLTTKELKNEMYLKGLNNIFKAMFGIRTVSFAGIKFTEIELSESQAIKDNKIVSINLDDADFYLYQKYHWDKEIKDWYDDKKVVMNENDDF